jgi:predicted phage terminase large subunit-like protein
MAENRFTIDPITHKRKGWVPPPRPDAEEREKAKREALATIRSLDREEAIQAARASFLPFVKFTMPDPQDPDDTTRSAYDAQLFHEAICATLEEVEGGRMPFLILTVPPRHGKSQLTSRHFPAWLLGRDPRRHIVVAAHTDTLAEDFGSDVRNIMATPQYRQVFPEVKLQRGGGAKGRLQTEQGGLAFFVGRGAALIGRGADFLILDDLIKSADEARSAATREEVWQWFIKVASTRRMNAESPVIIIMQRWHEDDPVGRITDPTNPNHDPILASKFKIIDLPAIAVDDDPLGRPKGAALWPESKGKRKFDIEFLEQQQRLDPTGFHALYQQQPSAVDGVLFKRDYFHLYLPDELPRDLTMYCASDHATGDDKAKHDATCLLGGGVDRNGDLWLTHCWWERQLTDRVVEQMLAMAREIKPLLWAAETGQITKSIGPFLRKRMAETNNFFAIREMTPIASKEARAQSISGRSAQGKVHFPKTAFWTEKAIDELLKFPNGRNDDFVDAFSWFGILLQSMFAPGPSAAERRAAEPRTGTYAWIKAMQKRQDRDAAAQRHGGY